ncbi:hypothetical protein TYRP_011086 [Tyrophagus putrescentiae]|nr:hypothetical protein TYRP_011086 [Tyrophagus putrescentiae]
MDRSRRGGGSGRRGRGGGGGRGRGRGGGGHRGGGRGGRGGAGGSGNRGDKDSDKKTTWTKSPYRSTNASKGPRGGKFGGSKRKIQLSFDEDDRQTFLSGFQKRKQERKQRAKEELEQRVKEEATRIREKRNEKLRKIVTDNTVAKELDQHAEYALEYDLPEQTVSIKGLDIGNISNSLGLTMGVNKPKTTKKDEKTASKKT